MNKLALLSLSMMLSGCAAMMPQAFQTLDDIETQQAINITIDKEAFQKDTDVHLQLDVVNKDQSQPMQPAVSK